MCPEELTLSLYFDQELSSEETRKVAAHIDECPACGEKVGEFRKTAGILASLAHEPDSETVERTRDRILHSTRYRETDSIRRTGFIRLPLPVAAAAAVMFILLAVWRFIPSGGSGVPVASDSLQEQNLEEDVALTNERLLNTGDIRKDREVVDDMLRSRVHEELISDGRMAIPMGFSESQRGQPVLTRVASYQEDQY